MVKRVNTYVSVNIEIHEVGEHPAQILRYVERRLKTYLKYLEEDAALQFPDDCATVRLRIR